MDLRQLRYFLTVAEERRFAGAARRLHVASPSLSQQIKVLERDLQVTLFERTPSGVALTPAGHVLVERARVILAEADRARDAVQTAASTSRERLALRICTMADPVLDGPLRAVGLGVPGVEVSVTSTPGDDAVAAVRQARADAAVVWRRPDDHLDLEGLVLGSVEFGVVLPTGHPLGARERVPVVDLAGETIVMFPWPAFSGVWHRTVDHLLPGGARPGQVVVETDLINSPHAMVRAVAAGAGIAPGILGVADRMGVSGVVVRPVDPVLRLDLELVWRGSATSAVRGLATYLQLAVRQPSVLVASPR